MTAVGSNAAAVAPVSVADSRRYCAELTRRSARNFYYGLRLLAEPKRSAMFALYAYMRLTDDIADEEDGRTIEQRTADLDAWEERTRVTLASRNSEVELGNLDRGPVVFGSRSGIGRPQLVWPAVEDLVRNYSIPDNVFLD